MSRLCRRLLCGGAIAALLLLFAACREAPQPALDPQALFPVEQNGQWGYVTGTGRLAIAPQFDRAYRFVDNRALVRTDERFGFIDTTGAVVIPARYAAAGHFSNGRAPVRPDSLWGFVDRAGDLAIPPRFGLSAQAGGVFGATGRGEADTVLVPPAVGEAPYFAEGRARIRTDGAWGFIDRSGAVVVPPRYTRAWSFRDGRARVRLADGRMGYVTPAGALVWPSGAGNAPRRAAVHTVP
jgi:hypothetical protein